jgi:CheY-like chemotaxis protein
VDGGKKAIAVLKEAKDSGNPYPLVLLDVNMPDMDGFTTAEHIKNTPELSGVTIMMLSSAGRREEMRRCKELGISIHLTKPVKQSELLEAIMKALGTVSSVRTTDAQHSNPQPMKPGSNLHILLAEDNPINQKLTIRVLQKRGHHVTLVENGKQALEQTEKEDYDLILMDVQMPVMGGFEATERIRAREKRTGVRTPIIAMTACAMKGDKEKCLQAGMNGYVSKPIQVDELYKTIEQVLSCDSLIEIENDLNASSRMPNT